MIVKKFKKYVAALMGKVFLLMLILAFTTMSLEYLQLPPHLNLLPALFFVYRPIKTMLTYLCRIILFLPKVLFSPSIRIKDISLKEIDDLGLGLENKPRGELFEKYLIGQLRNQGYNASATPSTGDFGVDIVLSIRVKRAPLRIGIQAKHYTGSVGVSAIQETIAGLKLYDCDIAVVVTNSTYTKNAKTLATANNVVLIDRSTLLTFIHDPIYMFERNVA